MSGIKVNKSSQGWGGPLYLKTDGSKDKVVSMTGNGIHPLAKYIANLIGGVAVDGFKKPPAEDEIVCVIINCGGTLRCGVYPQKKIFTINIHAIGPSGPLSQFIVEDLYVSGVNESTIELIDKNGDEAPASSLQTQSEMTESNIPSSSEQKEITESNPNFAFKLMSALGEKVGSVISKLFESGKESVDVIIKTIIPFMAFISILVALVEYTGFGEILANFLSPLGSSLWGLIILSIICSFPFLSPLLGPGAAIAQVIGVLIGTQIAAGTIPPQYALPALFAINSQVGVDFVPVGLSMQEANPKTIEYGTPAFLISRQITSPIAVIIAYIFSIGLF
jgi:PTS system glucitol/sorbitol-specific IIC component